MKFNLHFNSLHKWLFCAWFGTLTNTGSSKWNVFLQRDGNEINVRENGHVETFVWDAYRPTLVVSTETFQLVVAVGCKMQTKPVLAADNGGGKVGASEPGIKTERSWGWACGCERIVHSRRARQRILRTRMHFKKRHSVLTNKATKLQALKCSRNFCRLFPSFLFIYFPSQNTTSSNTCIAYSHR